MADEEPRDSAAVGQSSLGTQTLRYIRSMHSTSKVTWSESTSATVRGNVIIGSGRTGASRPTNRYTRFIHRDWHVGHGVDPDSTGAPTATQPADMPRRDGAKPG